MRTLRQTLQRCHNQGNKGDESHYRMLHVRDSCPGHPRDEQYGNRSNAIACSEESGATRIAGGLDESYPSQFALLNDHLLFSDFFFTGLKQLLILSAAADTHSRHLICHCALTEVSWLLNTFCVNLVF